MVQEPAAPDLNLDDRQAEVLARYRPVLEDWEAFLAAQRPASLPVTLSVNRARITRDDLESLLRAEGFAPQRLAWSGAALRLPPGSRPALHWTYAAGLFHVQEEASQLPLALLEARPGDRVLDLCAAPGGKSAQLCLDVGPTGTVVANDRDGKRLAALRDRMKRLGLVNLTTTIHDGASLPEEVGLFDRVLVDAPCSGEGNPSQKPAGARGHRADFLNWTVGTQRALLRRALACLKPGGRLVYSTCSLAPEENEAVLDWLLRETGETLRVIPAKFPGLASDPGLTEWQGRRFHPEVAKALRLWPHRAGTGAFFAVAIEKVGEKASSESAAEARYADPPAEVAEAARLLVILRQHFGLPASALAGLRFIAKGPHIQAFRPGLALPRRPRTGSLGLPIFRRGAAFPKPTTAAALFFGAKATRNLLEASAEEARLYLSRQPFRPDPANLIESHPRGYLLVRHKGYPLGLALLTRDPAGEATIDSQYPAAWARSFGG